jgi:hypothetical protein
MGGDCPGHGGHVRTLRKLAHFWNAGRGYGFGACAPSSGPLINALPSNVLSSGAIGSPSIDGATGSGTACGWTIGADEGLGC